MATLNRGIELVLLLTVPAAVALIAIPQPIVSVLFQHGNFTAQDSLRHRHRARHLRRRPAGLRAGEGAHPRLLRPRGHRDAVPLRHHQHDREHHPQRACCSSSWPSPASPSAPCWPPGSTSACSAGRCTSAATSPSMPACAPACRASSSAASSWASPSGPLPGRCAPLLGGGLPLQIAGARPARARRPDRVRRARARSPAAPAPPSSAPCCAAAARPLDRHARSRDNSRPSARDPKPSRHTEARGVHTFHEHAEEPHLLRRPAHRQPASRQLSRRHPQLGPRCRTTSTASSASSTCTPSPSGRIRSSCARRRARSRPATSPPASTRASTSSSTRARCRPTPSWPGSSIAWPASAGSTA